MAVNRDQTERIREAASGRWRELLATLGNVSAESLDGRNHPCPKCGGKDRFRLIDESAGAVLCNQCFNEKNGDGFAALGWLNGWSFPEAIARVAETVGVKIAKKNDPEKDLEFRSWNSQLASMFAVRRKGVTENALVAAGARLAQYKGRIPVFALPILGESLDAAAPVGWVLMQAMGGTLPKYNRKGEHIGDVKVKITHGSKPGLVGVHGVERIKATGLSEVVWKVEGVTDLLALWSAIPETLRERHVVVTNANGASEKPKWMAAALAIGRPLVLHDADKPGQVGAEEWAGEIARQGVVAGNVVLPYEVEESHGKDLRDFLLAGRKYDELLSLSDRAKRFEPPAEGGESQPTDTTMPRYELILDRLGLEVLYESRDQSVRVFSHRLRKSTTFDRITRISEFDLLQAAGPGAERHISDEPDGQTSWSMQEIRKALSLVASMRRAKHDDRGIGVWRGVNADGSNNEAVILANDNEAARWNGDRILRRIVQPRVDGLVLDFGDGDDEWYDYELLSSYVAKAADSIEWRERAIGDAVDLFKRWRWRGENDPELVAGLVMATWLQTIWAWRPLVAVVGESNCGKTTLFETLGGKNGGYGLFGGLAMSGAKSSEAGIRQGIGNTGRVVLLDEFEKSRERDQILQTFRASSRGDVVRKGTTHQKAVAFRLQHIVWLAAIESGLHRQPDINRFVQLELLEARRGQHGKLLAPPAAEAVDLGQRLLAASLVVAAESRQLAIDLKSVKVEGGQPRQIETYAVPAAILATSLGMDQPQAEGLLADLMSTVIELQADPGAKDQEVLLETILDSSVRCSHGREHTVAQLLESYHAGGSAYLSGCGDLERHGVAVRGECLAINCALVTRNLLSQTEWKGTRIDQLLMRLDGAVRRPVKLAGRPLRCVLLPLPNLSDEEPASATAQP